MSDVQAAEQKVLVPERSFSRPEERMLPAVQPAPANLMQALAIAAADPRMELAKVQGLWAIHKEMMDREAAQAFADAMACAQSRIEPIAKDRRNDHTKSMYATLAAICEEATPIYTSEGLSVSSDNYDPERDKGLSALKEGWVRVVSVVSHRGGYSRRYHLDGPLDDAGKDGTKNKTGIQALGSTITYLRRYLVILIFNIAVADDDDGSGGGTDNRMDEKKAADHLANIDAAADEPGLLKAFGLAWNAAEDAKDKSAQRLFIQHRDARRKAMRAGGRS